MSQQPATDVSNLSSEKSANLSASAKPLSGSAQSLKLRSCVVCRTRRVRCDKQSPCSNCRRAGIDCVFPSSNRPPKWARRFERSTATSNAPTPQDADPDVDNVVDRIRNLEEVVQELRSQLESAHAIARTTEADSSGISASGDAASRNDAQNKTDTLLATDTSGVQKHFGRLVLQDSGRGRYVSSGFWSEIQDEVDMLMMDTRAIAGRNFDSSDDEVPPVKTRFTEELERTPLERHAFLFRYNTSLSASDLSNFHPLPSQIPFLLDIFSENVNIFVHVVHMPTINKMIRSLRGSNPRRLTASEEALLFAIYYAAINSMDDVDIMTNFGSPKTDLNLKYRIGLEHALANADFLNEPDIAVVQALIIFLFLVRRHDSPRFVWMMTGLVIRMAHFLGLQRDGAHFKHLTPFEVEMRRRIWCAICALDARAAEDQGTELTIAGGSFDTKIPLNINNADIDPESKKLPKERTGITDMSFARVMYEMCAVSRQMMAPTAWDGSTSLEGQSRQLDEIYKKCEEGYLQHANESGNIAYWVAVTMARLMMAKMTLFVFLPVLFSSPSESLSEEIRIKLLVSAIEVAEYNHELNAEERCRQWRWLYQSCTHWHAVVYLLIEIPRRRWSPIVERAWVALHSSYLIPAEATTDKYFRTWVPIRKLMAKAQDHRNAELNRLRADPEAIAKLEVEDQSFPVPLSSGPFAVESSASIFRAWWRQIVGVQDVAEEHILGSILTKTGRAYPPSMAIEPTGYGTSMQSQVEKFMEVPNVREMQSSNIASAPSESASTQTGGSSNNGFPTTPSDPLQGNTAGYDIDCWLWANSQLSKDEFSNLNLDSFVDSNNMDLDIDVDWHNWIESASGIERGTGQSDNTWT